MAKELCEGGAKVVMLKQENKSNRGSCSPTSGRTNCLSGGFRGESRPLYQGDITKSITYVDCDNISVDRVRSRGEHALERRHSALRPARFQRVALNGIEEDWPLSYETDPIRSHRTDHGVCGNDDHLEILPAGKNYLPPIPWRCSEHIMKRATDAMGIPLIAVRKEPTQPDNKPPPCHYRGHCMDGCDVASIFSSPDCMLPKARATGISPCSRMPLPARSWSTARVWRSPYPTSTRRRARNSRSKQRLLWFVAPPWSRQDSC